MNPFDLLISPAHAQAAGAAPPPGAGLMTFAFPILLLVIMYFLMIRPQMKKAKEHKAMIDALSKGDEVVTSGGIAGKITKVGDTYVGVEIADNVEIQLQKPAVAMVLPKGTLKSL